MTDRPGSTPSQTVGPVPLDRAALGRRPARRARADAGRVLDPRPRRSTAPASRCPTRWSRPGRPTPTAASPPGRPARRRRLAASAASAAAPTDADGALRDPHGQARAGARRRRRDRRRRTSTSRCSPAACSNRVVTRIYFADEADAQRRRPGPAARRPERRRAHADRQPGRRRLPRSTSACRATMRPSSSPSEPSPRRRRLFGGVLGAAAAVAGAVSDAAWLRAMLDVEAALAPARAPARALIPAPARDAIAAACRDPAASTSTRSGAAAATQRQPGRPARAGADRTRVGGRGRGAHVHAGATSQDVLDTALDARRPPALGPLLARPRRRAPTPPPRSPARTATTPMVGPHAAAAGAARPRSG